MVVENTSWALSLTRTGSNIYLYSKKVLADVTCINIFCIFVKSKIGFLFEETRTFFSRISASSAPCPLQLLWFWFSSPASHRNRKADSSAPPTAAHIKVLGEMTEELQPESAGAELVVTEAALVEAEVPAAAKAEAEAEAEKTADEAAVTADDSGEETGSFKEESNLVDDLPDPQKQQALDEFKQLIAAALAAGEFNLPPPLPPPKAKEEPNAEETKTEEPKNEEPAKEEPKAEAEAADAPVDEVKTEVPPAEEAKAETVAEEAKPSEPEAQEKTVVFAVEEIEETVVSAAAAATSEEAAAPEVVAETQAAAPEPVLIWGVPLVGDDERTDTVLLKFLRAREFKVKEAMAMLKSTVLWRERFGITSLLDDDLGLPELENVVFYRGTDREGHPVCYNVYGEFQDKDLYERTFGDDEKRERFLKWRIQLLERGILSKLDFSPGGICSMVQVTDLKNSPPMLRKHRSVTRQAVALLQDNYPEFIAKKVAVRFSSSVELPIWNFIAA